MISDRVAKDSKIVSLAEAVATANETAKDAGVSYAEMRLFVEERIQDDGDALWRVNYMPISPPGTFQRGGGYMVEVDARNGSVRRALYGQ